MSLLNTVLPEDATGNVKETYAMFERMGMPVPLSVQMFSSSEDLMGIQGQMINYYMNHPSLSPALLAHIRLLAAHEENYAYCTELNRRILTTMIGLSEEQVAAAIRDPQAAALQPEEKALLSFVRKVARDPALTTIDDVDALKALGWEDRDVFDATMMAMNMVATGMMFKAFKMAAATSPQLGREYQAAIM